jgi:hypothetical protein
MVVSITPSFSRHETLPIYTPSLYFCGDSLASLSNVVRRRQVSPRRSLVVPHSSAPVSVPGWDGRIRRTRSLSLSYSSSNRGRSLPKSSIRGGESDEVGEEDLDVIDQTGNVMEMEKYVGKEEWDGMELVMDL